MQRLDKYLSEAGVASRRELKAIIRAGRVQVNGRTAKAGEEKVDETSDEIRLDGAVVGRRRGVLLMLHKPAGYVTSTDDPRDKTVMELLPPAYRALELKPVGRLDKDTEGLLLFTDDGEMLHRLISPRRHVWKLYYACHAGTASEADAEAFKSGMTLENGEKCLPAQLAPLGPGESLVALREGKYHQVRRMLAARGMPVTYLKRVGFGGLTLGHLPRGQVQEVTKAQVLGPPCDIAQARSHWVLEASVGDV